MQNVVDDRHQRFAAGADGLDEIALVGRKLGLEQQARHGDDAVHRRANLVAHVGQEFQLRPGALLRGATRRFETVVGLGQVALQALGGQDGAQAGLQFDQLERLGHVIRRARREAAHLVLRAVVRREHDDRQMLRARFGLELLQQFKAVHARQADIKQGEVKRLALEQCQGRAAIPGVGQKDLILLQRHGQHFGQIPLVLDEEQPRWLDAGGVAGF